MSRKPVLVQFETRLLEDIDRLCEELGESRSAVVRDAVERYIATESIAAKDRRMAEAFRKTPDDAEFATWAERSARSMVREEPW